MISHYMIPTIESLTRQELTIIGSALGVNVFHKLRARQKVSKDSFYRNRFYSGNGIDGIPLLLELQKRGLMKSSPRDNSIVFYVTKEGIQLFLKEYKKQLKGG